MGFHTRALHYLDAEGRGAGPLVLRGAFIGCVLIAVFSAALTTLPDSPCFARRRGRSPRRCWRCSSC
jgi:hypothetical protein